MAVQEAGHEIRLVLAQQLVDSGTYDYEDGTSCMRVLLEQFDSMVDAVEFIRLSFALVTPQDYCETINIATPAIRGVYDEYAFAVSDELFERFALSKRNWYLKFKLFEDRGRKVFILSLHTLNKYEPRRIGGPLWPG